MKLAARTHFLGQCCKSTIIPVHRFVVFFARLSGLGFSPERLKRICDPSVSEFVTSAIHYVVKKKQRCCLIICHTTSRINDI